MRVVIVANYEKAGQQSILRFGRALRDGLIERGCKVIYSSPKEVFGRVGDPHRGIGKWLAYIDKLLLYPLELHRLAAIEPRGTIFHICDHGNAMYASILHRYPYLITCHDMLPVRAAYGEKTDCRPSASGLLLQRWILASLRGARAVACVSNATANDFRRLANGARGRLDVVPMGLTSPYRRKDKSATTPILTSQTPLRPNDRFLLHVGSNALRKNREACLRIFAKVRGEVADRMVFAGERLSFGQAALASSLGIAQDVVELENIADAVLEALYNEAVAMVFPSTGEGFGFPIIEAQQCGCPVVTTNVTAIPEVAGDGAVLHAVSDEDGFAASLRRLIDPVRRAELIDRGLANAERFTRDAMVDRYLDIYAELIGSRCASST